MWNISLKEELQLNYLFIIIISSLCILQCKSLTVLLRVGKKKQVKDEPPNTYNLWPKWLMKGILSSDDICYGNMKLSK